MPLIHHHAIARIAALLFVATAVPAHAQQATGGFVARATAAPTDRLELSASQVRAILTAHQPAIVTGTADDNIATIVLASNGDYVASGTSKEAAVGAIRQATAGGTAVASGGAVAARADGASGGAVAARADGGSGGAVAARADGVAGGVEPRAVMAVPRDPDGQSHFIKIAGVGDIDMSLLKDTYWVRFPAGEVSVNALSVRIITLKGTAMK